MKFLMKFIQFISIIFFSATKNKISLLDFQFQYHFLNLHKSRSLPIAQTWYEVGTSCGQSLSHSMLYSRSYKKRYSRDFQEDDSHHRRRRSRRSRRYIPVVTGGIRVSRWPT